MKRILLLVPFGIVIFFSCKNSSKNSKNTPGKYVDTIQFYSYLSKINLELDSLIKNNIPLQLVVTDSSKKEKKQPIEVEQFKLLASSFLMKDITTMPVKQFYKESIFTDLTTSSIVINYTTTIDSLPIKNVDILLSDNNGNEIKRMDMKVMFAKTDSIITENYAWIFGKSFYINRYAEANGKGISTSDRVNWGKQ
ncbi:MAG: hypothetical protein KBF36_05885 [Chitinophagaceae bacterium]|nr:hypothetical protein [Chitinophagaceae bacterium]